MQYQSAHKIAGNLSYFSGFRCNILLNIAPRLLGIYLQIEDCLIWIPFSRSGIQD